MKSFLKYTLATIVGTIIVHFGFFFFFFIFISALATFSEKTTVIPDNSILTISFEGEISDRASDDPLESIDFLSMTSRKNLGMNQLLASIKNAAIDPRIAGIYLNLTEIKGNYGALAFTEEIRNALAKFKESGKFIYSYSNLGYSQASYYLATIADKIFVNPETPLLLRGMSSSISFYKETLEKLGIQAEIVKVGKFKSAVEPFIATEMSHENREQIKKYMDSSWETLIHAISESRNIPVANINALTDQFNIYPTEQFKAWGYVDDVVYEDQMVDLLKKRCNVLPSQELKQVHIADYQYTSISDILKNQKIAVIYAQGEIGQEQSNNSIGPELAATIRKVRKDTNVKAIVLRVNSPGGSALISDIIWRETALAKQSKPLIVSMGNVAASGGYYISCAADTIVAEATTLTGSIGIFGMFLNGEEFIQEKLGIHTSTVNTNKHSDFGGSFPLPFPISSRPLTSYEKNVLQNYVNQGYETFLQRVMAGRGLSYDELDAIAQGRVWTGKDAQQIGLVDVLGGLEEAIQIAAYKAGIENYRIAEYPIVKNSIEELLTELIGSVKTNILKKELKEFYPIWSQFRDMDLNQGLLARVPYDIVLQ